MSISTYTKIKKTTPKNLALELKSAKRYDDIIKLIKVSRERHTKGTYSEYPSEMRYVTWVVNRGSRFVFEVSGLRVKLQEGCQRGAEPCSARVFDVLRRTARSRKGAC